MEDWRQSFECSLRSLRKQRIESRFSDKRNSWRKKRGTLEEMIDRQMADCKTRYSEGSQGQILEDEEFGFSLKVDEMPLKGFIQERGSISFMFLEAPSDHKVGTD